MQRLFLILIVTALTNVGMTQETIPKKDIRAFHELIEEESVDKVESMLQTTPGLLTAELYGRSPVHTAAQAGRIDMLKLLIKKGAVPNKFTKRDRSILHYALKSDKFSDKLLKYTLSHIDVKAVDKKGSILADAVNNNRSEAIEPLIQAGASLEARNHMDMTPLLSAVDGKHIDCVKALLKAGADIEAKHEVKSYSPYWTSVFYATRNGDLNMLKLLVKHNAKLEQRDKRGQALLCFAGSAQVATYLLSKGAVANDKTNPRSALHGAASRGKVDIIALLIKAGADVNNTQGHNGGTPLHAACNSSEGLESIKVLIKHGSNVNAKSKIDITPLMNAARYGKAESVKLLLKAKASVKARGLFETTALHQAAEGGHVEVINILVKSGLSVNVKESNGDTPLHTAAKYSKPEAVKALLKAGARKSIKNTDGKTASDLSSGETKKLLDK